MPCGIERVGRNVAGTLFRHPAPGKHADVLDRVVQVSGEISDVHVMVLGDVNLADSPSAALGGECCHESRLQFERADVPVHRSEFAGGIVVSIKTKEFRLPQKPRIREGLERLFRIGERSDHSAHAILHDPHVDTMHRSGSVDLDLAQVV